MRKKIIIPNKYHNQPWGTSKPKIFDYSLNLVRFTSLHFPVRGRDKGYMVQGTLKEKHILKTSCVRDRRSTSLIVLTKSNQTKQKKHQLLVFSLQALVSPKQSLLLCSQLAPDTKGSVTKVPKTKASVVKNPAASVTGACAPDTYVSAAKAAVLSSSSKRSKRLVFNQYLLNPGFSLNLCKMRKKTNRYILCNAMEKYFEYSLQTYVRSNQDTSLVHRPVVKEGDWVQPGDLLADCSASVGGELSLGQNIFIAYMPWEGYNYEDAILISERLVYDDVYTSIHIEKYDLEIRETTFGPEKITIQIPDLDSRFLTHLDKNGIAKLGSWVEEGDILVGKITPILKKYQSPQQKLIYEITQKQLIPFRDSSFRAPKGLRAKVVGVQVTSKKLYGLSGSSKTSWKNSLEKPKMKLKNKSGKNPKPKNILEPKSVQMYLAEKRKIQVGDKMAGRHGNKGIVSQILPRQDMPYLPDGTPIDIVLNPLGVPSRMNVGQIYECLLGLAADYLGEYYRVPPFDEIYGAEASRSFVYSKLSEARRKAGCHWLFNPTIPGKIRIFDGRTGEPFDQGITVGKSYILKLVHLVDDKIHMRSTGPYSLVTQQPLRGRSKQGGQRLGEMEVWALQGYGAAFTLLEMLTIKSDNITGRLSLWTSIIYNHEIYIGTPESFKVLVCELQALCLDIGLFRVDNKGLLKEIEHLMKLP